MLKTLTGRRFSDKHFWTPAGLSCTILLWKKNLFFILRDVADMIIVLDPEYVEKNEVLATISDIRAYGFRSCFLVSKIYFCTVCSSAAGI